MSDNIRKSLYNISFDGNQFTHQNGVFDAFDYSKFKYGNVDVAERYGVQLADLIMGDISEYTMLTSSAYRYAPSAAYFAFRGLQKALKSRGRFVDDVRIHRANVVEGDYANLSLAEREKYMHINALSIDATEIKGKDLIVLDDVRITGAHERSIERLLVDTEPNSVTYLYLLELDENDGNKDPELEYRLNHGLIKDIPSYLEMYANERVEVNARAVKMLLTPANRDDLVTYVANVSDEHLRQVLYCSVMDGYDTMELYRPSFEILDRMAKAIE
jgi:hypothetical protein